MQAFTHHTPTEIMFGRSTEEQVGALIKKYGGTRVMVVYGGGSVVKSGLLKRVSDKLSSEQIVFTEFGGVKPNPLLSHARDGVEIAKEFKADFILAVGGGSAIDTAKAIALGTVSPEIDIWKFWKREIPVEKSLPVGVILTIAAAGSETSNSAVLTDVDAGEKRGFSCELMRPCFAIMNPELTFTLPKYQIACGVTDIFMHTLDRYFTQTEGNQLTDEIARAILRTLIKNAPKALENPFDYEAVSEIMWCGSLSHNGITGLGRPMDFSVHQLGHELGGRFDKAHGATLATMWGSWAKYCYEVKPERFAHYSENVWGDRNGNGIESTIVFFKSIGMPTCFTELGVGILEDKAIEEMAESCVFYGKRTIGNFKVLKKEDVVEIYKMANH